MRRDAALKMIIRMAVAWRSETGGPLCESVDGESGELGGDVVHGVVGSSEIASLSGCTRV
jgi:hypothetical protein